MILAPLCQWSLWQKDADGICKLAVGGHVENELRGGRFWIIRQGQALSHEVILVDVSLRTGIGLQSANRHPDIMELWRLPCRGLKIIHQILFHAILSETNLAKKNIV